MDFGLGHLSLATPQATKAAQRHHRRPHQRTNAASVQRPSGRDRFPVRPKLQVSPQHWPLGKEIQSPPSVRGKTRLPSTWSCLRSARSEEHTSELQSLMRISYAVFCLKKKKHTPNIP